MTSSCRVLVVGAGPSGLAFALASAAQGQRVTIIDQRPARSMIQKATGVALASWQQLAAFGISPASTPGAIPMRNFVFYDDGRHVADIHVPLMNGEPPAHLFPQGELEMRMEALLREQGIEIQYGTNLLALTQDEQSVSVRIQNAAGESEQQFDWLIAADGAHSPTRHLLDLPFPGRDYPEQWSVAEIFTQAWDSNAQARLFLQSDGVGLFLSQPAAGVLQGILNASGVAQRLQEKFPDAQLRYERQFRVALRRVKTPRCGRVWLIGDAAHVQSPVGGQGLNLAIWDGIELAQALYRGDMAVEQRLARRAKLVLRFTDFDYRMLASRNRLVQWARNTYWQGAARRPFLASWFFKLISGVW